MKKSAVIISAALIAAALSGCTGKTVIKSGTVTAVDPNKITITAYNGSEHSYTVDQNTVVEGISESLGEIVEVRCKGEPKGDKKANLIKLSKPAETTPSPVNIIYGTVSALSDSSVTVLANDTLTYTVARDDSTTVHSSGSISEGSNAEIIYIGSMDDKSAVAQSIIMTSEKENAAAPTPVPLENEILNVKSPTTETVRYFTGECAGNNTDAVSLKFGGVVYRIAKDGSTVTIGNVAEGDSIRVFYKGNLKNGIFASKIALMSKPNADENSDAFRYRTFYGVISNVSNTSVTVTSNGAENMILKNEETEVSQDATVGAFVEVKCYTMDDGQLMAKSIK